MAESNSSDLSSYAQRRLQRELQSLIRESVPEVTIDTEAMGCQLHTWYVDLTVPHETLYAGETMRLRFKFGSDYPWKAPEVIFDGPNIPVHPHVYSNGHICLSILSDWTPAMTVFGICLSIVSMLSSCKEKRRPGDDERYVSYAKGMSPLYAKWNFHDDTV